MKKIVCLGAVLLLSACVTSKYTQQDNTVVLKVYNICSQDTSYVIPNGITKLKICDRSVTVDRMGSTLYLTGPVNEILIKIPEVQVHLTSHDLLIDDKPWVS